MTTKPQDDVTDHLLALMHLFRSSLRQSLAESPDGIGPMEARVLGFFARNPRSTQSDLVEHSGRDKAQIARLVKPLVERGLLVSTPDANDRRATRLDLTASGRATQRRLQQHQQRLAARLTADFSAEERAQVKCLLERMRNNIETALPPAAE